MKKIASYMIPVMVVALLLVTAAPATPATLHTQAGTAASFGCGATLAIGVALLATPGLEVGGVAVLISGNGTCIVSVLEMF